MDQVPNNNAAGAAAQLPPAQANVAAGRRIAVAFFCFELQSLLRVMHDMPNSEEMVANLKAHVHGLVAYWQGNQVTASYVIRSAAYYIRVHCPHLPNFDVMAEFRSWTAVAVAALCARRDARSHGAYTSPLRVVSS